MNCSTGDEWRVSENDQPCVTENETIVNNYEIANLYRNCTKLS
jgi:hypothetical protein